MYSYWIHNFILKQEEVLRYIKDSDRLELLHFCCVERNYNDAMSLLSFVQWSNEAGNDSTQYNMFLLILDSLVNLHYPTYELLSTVQCCFVSICFFMCLCFLCMQNQYMF